MLLAACSAPAPTSRPAETLANRPAPPAPPPPSACAPIDGNDALALAEKPDRESEIDLDGQPATRERFVAPDCSGLRCTYRVYAERAGCWTLLGEVSDLMDAPYCERGTAVGEYCTLSGMRLMIHGDAQQYLFAFHGSYGPEEPGPRHVDGPSKRP